VVNFSSPRPRSTIQRRIHFFDYLALGERLGSGTIRIQLIYKIESQQDQSGKRSGLK